MVVTANSSLKLPKNESQISNVKTIGFSKTSLNVDYVSLKMVETVAEIDAGKIGVAIKIKSLKSLMSVIALVKSCEKIEIGFSFDSIRFFTNALVFVYRRVNLFFKNFTENSSGIIFARALLVLAKDSTTFWQKMKLKI